MTSNNLFSKYILGVVLFLSLFCHFSALAQDKFDCLPIDVSQRSQLPGQSPFWFQEYTGVDLVKKDTSNNSRRVPIAIFDTGFKLELTPILTEFYSQSKGALKSSNQRGDRGHGTAVFHLASGNEPSSTSSVTDVNWIHNVMFDKSYTEIEEELRVRDISIELVNISMGWNDNIQHAIDTCEDLKKNGSIFFIAAGNKFPKPTHPGKLGCGITVGNLTGHGFISENSQKPVTVVAPGSKSISIKGNKKYLSSFGGTSAASPQALGATSYVKSILPEVRQEDLEKLFRMTAIPTLNSLNQTGDDGPGLVNAPLMQFIAQEIRTTCPTIDETCVKKEMAKIESFQPIVSQEEISSKIEELASFLGGCGKKTELAPAKFNCTSFKEKYHNFRRLTYQARHNKDAWNFLSCSHQKMGFEVNSFFYDTIAISLSEDPLMAMWETISRHEILFETIISDFKERQPYLFSFDHLKRFVRDSDSGDWSKKFVYYFANYLENKKENLNDLWNYSGGDDLKVQLMESFLDSPFVRNRILGSLISFKLGQSYSIKVYEDIQQLISEQQEAINEGLPIKKMNRMGFAGFVLTSQVGQREIESFKGIIGYWNTIDI